MRKLNFIKIICLIILFAALFWSYGCHDDIDIFQNVYGVYEYNSYDYATEENSNLMLGKQ